ncbi:SIMPL domain-containing protein [Actinoplanes sp. NPDC051851]|uniref:SIMPL domain-containing protein n=1 Tax=Actinoplanes sp. NPDC051851 TaxID=3154753 RepID=UPI00343AE372
MDPRPEPPIVTARGEAVREVPPETARFSVTVSAAGKDQAGVLERLTRRAAEIDALLDEYATVVERRETSGVQVHPEFRRGGERVTAYTGNVGTTVTVSDFARLGELLARLAGQEATAVAGPWWQMRPGSDAGAEVRREAVADALRRARDYAAAVGAEIDRLVEITDGELESVRPMLRAAAFGTAEAGDLAFDLHPAPQTVSAAVTVRVTITEPADL